MEYRNIIESCIGSNKQVSIEREEVDDEPVSYTHLRAHETF